MELLLAVPVVAEAAGECLLLLGYHIALWLLFRVSQDDEVLLNLA